MARPRDHSKDNGTGMSASASTSEGEGIGEPLSRGQSRRSPVSNVFEFVIVAGSKWGFPAVMCLVLMGWVWFITTSNQSAAAVSHALFAAAMKEQTTALTKSLDTLAAEQRVQTRALEVFGNEQKVQTSKLTEIDAALDAHLRHDRAER